MTNPATALTDRINALATRPGLGVSGAFVSRDEVLAIVANAVPVEVDMDMYSEALSLATDEQKEALAVISTAYNLLADKAAEFAARAVHKRAEGLGVELTPDAEMFAKYNTSYHDLAAHNPDRVEDLGKIFQSLIDQSVREATMALVTSMTADLGVDLHGLEEL